MYQFALKQNNHSFDRNCCNVHGNCVDIDKTPRFMASDLGLHCLSVSPQWDPSPLKG